MILLRRLPMLPTLIVLIAIGIMIRLGLWQLDRMAEKEALLASHAAAQTMSSELAWPTAPGEAERSLYRRGRLVCAEVLSTRAIAGRNASGTSGLAQIAHCRLAGGGEADVVLGWSQAPAPPVWRGGAVGGIIAPGPRLVADPPQAGLQANAVPDPAQIPNNHLSYAVQWFLFAGVALVIYVLAVRKRLQGK